MSPSRNSARCRTRRVELSKTELLAVLVTFAGLMAFTMPLMMGLGKSRALAIAGQKVTELIMLARENAVAKNLPTALILLINESSEADFRALTIVECQKDGTWRQIANWEPLPVGVAVDLDHRNCTFLDDSPMLDGLDGPQLGYRDKILTGTEFACRIFLPDGGLSNPLSPAKIRLVEGSENGVGNEATVRYAHPRKSTFYDIAIIGATGTVETRHR